MERRLRAGCGHERTQQSSGRRLSVETVTGRRKFVRETEVLDRVGQRQRLGTAGRGTLSQAAQTLTRSTYSPVRVSMRTVSPVSMKAGTCTSPPVSTVAALVMLPEVLPRTAGSV